MAIPQAFVLLLQVSVVMAMDDIGYNECVYNTYYTRCFGDGVQLHLPSKGLTKFPTLNHKEECLMLQGNEILAFPQDLMDYETLYTLNVARNRISFLPDDLYLLLNLKVLDVSGNQLARLSTKTRYSDTLEALILKDTGLKAMPGGLEIPGLLVLDLSMNQFTDITREFCVSSQLIRLDVTQNSQLSDVSNYIDILNHCRNMHKITFCLFTDREYIKCDCSTVGPLLVETPAFRMGNPLHHEMRCSGTSSAANYSDRLLFDVNVPDVKEACGLTLKRNEGGDGNGVAGIIGTVRVLFVAWLLTLYNYTEVFM